MALDLSLVSSLAEKVVLVAVGVLATRLMERRARLVVFYGHVGRFQLAGPQPATIHTHTIVLRNSGRLPSHNVRVPHRGMLTAANINVSVDSGIKYDVEATKDATEDIVFPVLAPHQQVTISYLYPPTITFDQINLKISSDEGMARVLNVLPTPQYPRPVLIFVLLLMIVGAIAVLYGIVELSRWVAAHT